VADRMAELGQASESLILDVACGTGDLALTLFETTGAEVVGTDFCRPMLSIAAEKVRGKARLVEGDALHLPFREGAFDVVTIAFGLRNLASVQEGLAELHRVLKCGGWLAVLEFSKPANPAFRAVFGTYFTRLLPVVGGIISGSKSAYGYLPDSVKTFPDQGALSGMLQQTGFVQVRFENLTGGIAALHLARKPLQRLVAP
jgi:demethylmenaquinone methyltransferase / 2-methoxy-6-polyprenyl-1,4-benzoquinol methylase